MNFGEAIKSFWTNYATFKGRASRSEFWFAILFIVLVRIGLNFIDMTMMGSRYNADNDGYLGGLFALATFIPLLAISWRRLHDIDKSGGFWFFYFIPIVGWIFLLVWFCTKGKPEANRFGEPVALS